MSSYLRDTTLGDGNPRLADLLTAVFVHDLQHGVK